MSRASSQPKCCVEDNRRNESKGENTMDTDLTPVDEIENDEFEETWELAQPAQPVSAQDRRPGTIVTEGLTKYFNNKEGWGRQWVVCGFTFTKQQLMTLSGPSR